MKKTLKKRDEMFFGLGKKDEQKSNLWSDILITLVISKFIWTLAQKGFLRIPSLLAILIIAFVCLFLLRRRLASSLLSFAGVAFFVLELALSNLPYFGVFLVLCLVIIIVGIVLSPILGR